MKSRRKSNRKSSKRSYKRKRSRRATKYDGRAYVPVIPEFGRRYRLISIVRHKNFYFEGDFLDVFNGEYWFQNIVKKRKGSNRVISEYDEGMFIPDQFFFEEL